MRAERIGIDRRTFLVIAAAGAGALTLPAWVGPRAGAGTAMGDLPPGSTLSGLAISGSRAVGVGSASDGTAAVWVSDGRGWTPAPAAPAPEAALGDVEAVGGSFVAVGSLDRVPTAWHSSDGSRWRVMAQLPAPGHLTSVGAAGPKVLAGGAVMDAEAGEGVGPLLASLSRSGRWGRLATHGLDLPHGSVTAVGHRGSRWVVAGTSTAASGLWSSGAGAWVAAPTPGPVPIVWSSLIRDGAGLLALGTDLAGDVTRLARTADGLRWTMGSVPSTLARLGIDLRAAARDGVTGLVTVGGLDERLQRVGLR